LIKIEYEALGMVLRDLGFDGCDLAVVPGGHVPPEKAGSELMRAIESVSGVGLEVPILTTAMTSGGDPAGRTVLSIAGFMGIPVFRPGYWHYGTSYTVYLLAALESALGTDFGLSSARGFDRTGRFRIYFSGPSGKTFNYADAHDHTDPAPEMFWLAHRFAEPAYAWQEQRLLETGGNPNALDLIWFQPDARSPKQEGWPLNAIFHGVQTAFLWSAWDDPNALFVGVKGGDNKANHGHLDLGNFVLDGGGIRWALDLGPDDYNLPAVPGRSIRYSCGVQDEVINQISLSVLAEMMCPTAAGRMLVETSSLLLAARLAHTHSETELIRRPISSRHRLHDGRLRRVLAYIEEHLAEDITVADLTPKDPWPPFPFDGISGVPAWGYL
jgi:hypothetical protein